MSNEPEADSAPADGPRKNRLQLYAILGHAPLASASPPMQEAAFAAAGLHARYLRIAETDAGRALKTAQNIGLSGANVTAPLKESVFRLVEPDAAALAIGAVNTLSFLDGGRAVGRNTDPDGIAGALAQLGAADLKGCRAAVIGTGGAARAAVYALRRGGADVTVLGRRPERAEHLAEALGAQAAFPLQSEASRQTLLSAHVIVGTADTRERIVPPEWLRPGTFLLDAQYGVSSALLLDASARGLVCADGSAWLLHQGAESFAWWTGMAPDMAAMRRALSRSRVPFRARPAKGLTLVGFSGSGKSSAAPLAASACGLKAADSDDAVSRAAACPIPEMFRTAGEAAFRDAETAELERASAVPSVLASGGGACLRRGNRPLLSRDRLVIWLAVSPQCALERIAAGTRPLLTSALGDKETLQTAERRMEERREGYALTCDVVIDAERPLEEVAAAAARLWKSLPPPDAGPEPEPAARDGETASLPPSKSQLIRCLVAAALADSPSRIHLPKAESSSQPDDGMPSLLPQDAQDALRAAEALGAKISWDGARGELAVTPAQAISSPTHAPTKICCGESALLCRLLMAVTSALGLKCELLGKGTLTKRLIRTSLAQLEMTGARFTHGPADDPFPITIRGGMTAGDYRLDASVTSQVASGLLMALPLCGGTSRLTLEDAASRPYLGMTLAVMRQFGVAAEERSPGVFLIPGRQRYRGAFADIESDWSAAAFPLVVGAVRTSGPPVILCGLNLDSLQGDRRILDILESAGAVIRRMPDGSIFCGRGALKSIDVSLRDAPDLLPPLAVLALFCSGTSRLRDIGRTRHKESDRPAALTSQFFKLGGQMTLAGDALVIEGSRGGAALHGGAVSSCGDHRIAMALAAAAAAAGISVDIEGAETAVRKSCPSFFKMLRSLGTPGNSAVKSP